MAFMVFVDILFPCEHLPFISRSDAADMVVRGLPEEAGVVLVKAPLIEALGAAHAFRQPWFRVSCF
jgi:hypothetical protein